METTTSSLIRSRMETETAHNEMAERLIAALAKHNGKKFTKRLLPELSQAAGVPVTYSDYLNMPKLKAGEISLGLAWWGKGRPDINIDSIRESNSCYLGPARARNEQRVKSLEDGWAEEADRLCLAFNQAKAELEAFLGNHPDRFGILALHNIEI